jgi:hypothetical protein
MKMKKLCAVLFSFILLVNMCSEIVLAAETDVTDINVDYSISEELLKLEISDIPVVNSRQMLSVSVVHKDSDINDIKKSDILYSNSIYLNGRQSVAMEIDYDDAKIMEYRLVITDSHAGINYSHLLAVKIKSFTAKQYEEFQKANPNEGPKENGYVFSGWFTDEKCTKVLSTNTVDGKAYAKFVDANVLTVKGQITANTNQDSEKTNMRFVTTVDSLNYEKIGFIVKIEGREEQIVSTHVVYEHLLAVGNDKVVDTLSPSEEFSPISLYFGAYSYLNIPKEDFEVKFTVTPYWITLDGTTVYGKTEVKTVSMGYNKEVM